MVIIFLSLDGNLGDGWRTSIGTCDQYGAGGIDKCLVLSKSYYSDLFG